MTKNEGLECYNFSLLMFYFGGNFYIITSPKKRFLPDSHNMKHITLKCAMLHPRVMYPFVCASKA